MLHPHRDELETHCQCPRAPAGHACSCLRIPPLQFFPSGCHPRHPSGLSPNGPPPEASRPLPSLSVEDSSASLFIVRLLPPERPLRVAGLPPSPALSLRRLGRAQIHDLREELAVGLVHARLSAVPLLQFSRQTQVSTHWSPGMKRVLAFTSLPAPVQSPRVDICCFRPPSFIAYD